MNNSPLLTNTSQYTYPTYKEIDDELIKVREHYSNENIAYCETIAIYRLLTKDEDKALFDKLETSLDIFNNIPMCKQLVEMKFFVLEILLYHNAKKYHKELTAKKSENNKNIKMLCDTYKYLSNKTTNDELQTTLDLISNEIMSLDDEQKKTKLLLVRPNKQSIKNFSTQIVKKYPSKTTPNIKPLVDLI